MLTPVFVLYAWLAADKSVYLMVYSSFLQSWSLKFCLVSIFNYFCVTGCFELTQLLKKTGKLAFLGYTNSLFDVLDIDQCYSYYGKDLKKNFATCLSYQNFVRFLAFGLIFLIFLEIVLSYYIWRTDQPSRGCILSFPSTPYATQMNQSRTLLLPNPSPRPPITVSRPSDSNSPSQIRVFPKRKVTSDCPVFTLPDEEILQ